MEHHIPFKILPIVDSTSRRPPFIGDLHPNIKVVFLPPNTTSSVQPMDPGVPTAYTSYLRRTFAWAVATADEDTDTVLDGLHLRLHQEPCSGLGVVSPRSVCVAPRRRHSGVCPWGLFMGFAKGKEDVKITKAEVAMTCSLNLGVAEGDVEDLLEVVPEELT